MTEIRTYRGHIRNWKALCEELKIEGAKTMSREEREPVILQRAYEEWGHDMGMHMHGMFAFAIWDGEKQELFCLRDPFGTKPFYYYLTEEGKLLYAGNVPVAVCVDDASLLTSNYTYKGKEGVSLYAAFPANSKRRDLAAEFLLFLMGK